MEEKIRKRKEEPKKKKKRPRFDPTEMLLKGSMQGFFRSMEEMAENEGGISSDSDSAGVEDDTGVEDSKEANEGDDVSQKSDGEDFKSDGSSP